MQNTNTDCSFLFRLSSTGNKKRQNWLLKLRYWDEAIISSKEAINRFSSAKAWKLNAHFEYFQKQFYAQVNNAKALQAIKIHLTTKQTRKAAIQRKILGLKNTFKCLLDYSGLWIPSKESNYNCFNKQKSLEFSIESINIDLGFLC